MGDKSRATFEPPPTDDLAIISVVTLVPLLFMFFYICRLLLLEVRKFKNPEKYLEVAERERKLATVQGKIEREQEKRLEMTAWFAKERAERLRCAENFRDETDVKIQANLSAISKELRDGGVAVTPSRARKEQPLVQRTPVKAITNPLKTKAANAKGG